RAIDAAAALGADRLVFTTSTSLDPADTNTFDDAYLRDLTTGRTTLLSRASGAGGAVATTGVTSARISGDGQHVVFTSTANDLGVPGSTQHVYVRDLSAATTVPVDRQTGPNGIMSDTGASGATISADGSKVAFTTTSKLDPADTDTLSSAYVRDLTASTTTLVSRGPGASGASVFAPDVRLSGDGSTVAFTSYSDAAVPATAPWIDTPQIVARSLATGTTTLVSRGPGGVAAAGGAFDPAIDGDGSVVAFGSTATNLMPGVGGDVRSAVFAKDLTTGTLSAPPAFGVNDSAVQNHADFPSLSADGRCMAFTAFGHNAATGVAGDFENAYVFAISGDCPKAADPIARPPGGGAPGQGGTAAAKLAAPTLTALKLSASRFTVVPKTKPKKKPKTPAGSTLSFSLGAAATVKLAVDRPSTGRKDGKTCRKATRKLAKKPRCTRYTAVGSTTTATLGAGAHKITFTGKLGTKTLAPGKYRLTLTATNAAGTSAPLTATFTIVRK
ncbi:MAG: hypothetical protein REI11_18245, partial [Patulibacter sp.]|nr:hypothetical protein [Patulibacter sp.]